MFSLETIIEFFALVVIVFSILGSMWLAGHIYFKYQNWKQEQEDKRTPPLDEEGQEQEKIVAWWRD